MRYPSRRRVRPSLTVEPYAIAKGMPLNLAAGVAVFFQNPPALSTDASKFFFTNGTSSNETLLVGWEHDHIPPTVNALTSTYNAEPSPTAPNWSDSTTTPCGRSHLMPGGT